MELVLVTNTSRNAVVELTEAGKYYSKKEYDIYVNGELFTHTDKQVTSLYGFKPDTDYEITAVYDGKEYGPVELHTDYEFVTLNVRDFGAYGDGVHDDTNAIQCAIMASKKNCRVYVPEGTYRISSIFLKDQLDLPRRPCRGGRRLLGDLAQQVVGIDHPVAELRFCGFAHRTAQLHDADVVGQRAAQRVVFRVVGDDHRIGREFLGEIPSSLATATVVPQRR